MVKVIVLLTNGDHTENTILIRNSIYQKYNKDNISTEIIVQERIKRGLKYISKTQNFSYGQTLRQTCFQG